MDIVAKCDSYGFQGRYWNKGDKGTCTAEEVKQFSKSKTYFDQLFETTKTDLPVEGQE